MNNDLISRKALLDTIGWWIEDMGNVHLLDERYYKAMKRAESFVEKADAVDAEHVRHGRWITESIPQEGYNTFCSRCKRLLHNAPFIAYNYCPHCGAKMDAKE